MVEELQKKKQYIRGGKGDQLDLSLVVETLDTGKRIGAKVLVDSGWDHVLMPNT